MSNRYIFAGLCALGLAYAGGASAVIVGGEVTSYSGNANGTFINLTVPFSESSPDNTVGNNTFNTANLYAFNEDQNIVLADTLNVDIGRDMLAGEVIASHYVFFDPLNLNRQKGYVDFDADVIGIATSRGTLSASDFLANNDVTYKNPTLRGLENGDHVTVAGSRIYVDWRANTPGDYIRVFTERSPVAAVPLPATLPLLAFVIGGLGFVARRKA